VYVYTYVYSKFIVIYLLYLNKVSHTCIAAYVTRVQYAYYGARVRDRYVRSLQLYYYRTEVRNEVRNEVLPEVLPYVISCTRTRATRR
jgi:hypothetical protein